MLGKPEPAQVLLAGTLNQPANIRRIQFIPCQPPRRRLLATTPMSCSPSHIPTQPSEKPHKDESPNAIPLAAKAKTVRMFLPSAADVNPDAFLSLLRTLLLDPDFWFLIAAVAFVLAILLWLVNRPPALITAFRGDQGNASVSRHAIADLVHRVCASTDGVGKSACTIGVKGGRLALRVKIHLQSSATLTDLTAELQERIATHLRHSFGFAELGPIDIVVTGFQGDANPAALKEPVKDESEYGDNFPATYASGYDLPAEDSRR